jgi:hypothetical protein
MIYGRRFFEKNKPRLSSFEQKVERLHNNQKSLRNLYQKFQYKYSWFYVLAVVGPFFVFALPCLYFANENYQIFTQLAYDVRPDLLNHLEREMTLLFGLFAFAVLGTTFFCYWLTVRLMGLIAGPIWAIERHMKQVTLGDWSSEDFRLRTQDEFQSLASTYSYLYRSLRIHTRRELESLQSLNLDPQDQATYTILKNLIEIKKMQLGLSPNGDPVEEISSSPSQRHAS